MARPVGPDIDGRWFVRFAEQHDKLAKFIRDTFPDEPDAGKPTNPEIVFDTAIRLLRGYRELQESLENRAMERELSGD